MAQPQQVRITVVGEAGTGKSALVVRFVQDVFVERYDPTVEDSYLKMRTVSGQEVMLSVFDSAGAEGVHSNLFTAILRESCGVLLLFDMQQTRHLDALGSFLPLVQEHCPDAPRMLVGTKYDQKDPQVTVERAEEMAEELGMKFIATSAKTRFNVDEPLMLSLFLR